MPDVCDKKAVAVEERGNDLSCIDLHTYTVLMKDLLRCRVQSGCASRSCCGPVEGVDKIRDEIS